MKKTPPFEPGMILDEAGVEIVRIAEHVPQKMERTRYEVIYLCCGNLGFLTHGRITARISQYYDKCKKCEARFRVRDPVLGAPPGLPIKFVPSLKELGLKWPAPPLAVRLFREERR